jgi:hypothetical protein
MSSTASSSSSSTTPPFPKLPAASVSSSLAILRVSQQELSSGHQGGQVLLRLSPGAVALPVDRVVAQARVSRQVRAAIDAAAVTE